MVLNHKIKVILKTLRSIVSSIYFNFHYLPIKQAIHFPILLYKPCFLSLKGKVEIDSDKLHMGMIRLGWDSVSLYYPNNRYGIIFENHGGKIVFQGEAILGSGSAISIGKKGLLVLGDNCVVTSNFKMVSYNHIKIGDNFRGGWDTIVMDTDLHCTIDCKTGKRSVINGEIVIGKNNWIGNRCFIQKKAKTPDYCIIGANSIVNKALDFDQYCFCSGNPVALKKTGIYRDLDSFDS